MIRFKKNSLEWLQFEHLSEIKQLKHAIFTRRGGVSQGSVGGLNFGSLVAPDDPQNVYHNTNLAKEALEISTLFWSNQCHSDRSIEAKSKAFNENLISDADSLITDEKNLGLMNKHGDCQIAILYDPQHHAVANVHCGWRGNVSNIYQKTIEKMKDLYETNPADLLVGISPSLGPQASEFINYEKELPLHFRSFRIKPTYFNLWEISKMQLINAGVLKEHIEIAQICTFSNQDDWFSYRFDKKSGRNATIACLL